MIISLQLKPADFSHLKLTKVLISDVVTSFLRVCITSLIAWSMAIMGGYFIFHIKVLQHLFMPTINFIRHISPFAWLPFAIIWFGLGESSVAFIMLITLFFPALIAVADQFRSIPHEYIDEANVSGASLFQIFRFVELPLSFSNLLNLFRIIWGLGWSVIIAAEMLGVNSGLGFRLLDFRYLLKYADMLLYFVVMGTLGIAIDALLSFFISKIKT
jgi:NitT/TauT family transport system permease protein